MQKVVGSSPIIRLKKPCLDDFFVVNVGNPTSLMVTLRFGFVALVDHAPLGHLLFGACLDDPRAARDTCGQ
jgi:hypothetical protein